MASDEGQIPNIYAYRGRHLLLTYSERNKHVPDYKLFELIPPLHFPLIPKAPVCIIGAGMAGLYTAMIFESLGIPYQIVEANTPARIGGRMFTYHFPYGGPYDYYDVGAMRYPDTPFMKRTFDLIRNRGLNVKLIPYILQMVNPPKTFLFYNNARVHNQDKSVSGDPFGVEAYVADKSLTTPEGVSTRVGEVLQPFRDLFVPKSTRRSLLPWDIASAMNNLFDRTKRYSTRSYMILEEAMDPKDVQWCETLDKSTAWYDLALTETVIESLAFDWPTAEAKENPNVGWYCIDGGSSTLPRAMFDSLAENAREEAKFNSRVTAIARDEHDPGGPVMKVTIETDGSREEHKYSAVISTVPLPRLSLMDLTGAGIHENYAQWSAIRELRYSSSIKIGIKFSVDWWEQKPLLIHGGQSYTDLPLRTIVYPSYPENAGPGERSKVLIASYCWTQDAERLGALIHSDGTAEPELLDLVFRDLATVHGVKVSYIKQYYQGEYFAWDWLHNPTTMGAFALFGPSVYDQCDVYSEMLRPAARGGLFFAGEATSACHAWVAGALDSAWRAVDQYLAIHYPDPPPSQTDPTLAPPKQVHNPVREKFWKLWGKTEYWDEDTNSNLVELNHTLTDRHLVIALHKDGVRV